MITVEDIVDPIKPELERAAATMSPDQYGRHVQEVVAIQIWRQINERLVYREALSRLDDRMDEILGKKTRGADPAPSSGEEDQ